MWSDLHWKLWSQNTRRSGGSSKRQCHFGTFGTLERILKLTREPCQRLDASCTVTTVDGRNPAPPGMYKTLKTMGYLPYQLVQDFVHQQYYTRPGTV